MEGQSIKHYDGTTVAIQFINYFYQSWLNNPDILINDTVVKPFTKFKINNNVYSGNDFIQVLKHFRSEDFKILDCKYEIFDSGSRQVYILVSGIIQNNYITKQFSQSFMIAYVGENKGSNKWTLMNSIFIYSK